MKYFINKVAWWSQKVAELKLKNQFLFKLLENQALSIIFVGEITNKKTKRAAK